MRITALIENTALDGFCCEHGLSLYLEFNSLHLLLDTGATGVFSENAHRLGIDLGLVDAAVLSHSHYDHAGGWEEFFRLNSRAPVYLRSAAKEPCYTGAGFFKRYIGPPRGLFAAYPDRFRFVDGDMELFPGVWLLPDRGRDLARKGKAARMYRGLLRRPDDFAHEQSLVFVEEDGLVVLNSCCHAGADTVAAGAKAAFPGKSVKALIGGFHLMGPNGYDSLQEDEGDVRALARRLEELEVKKLYTGHCTGAPGFAILKSALGDRVEYLPAGASVEI